MTSSRYLEEHDAALLAESLAKDTFHKDTPVKFFYAPGSMSLMYEDEQGPVFVVRGTKALRLDIQFLDNRDFERNRKTLEDQFPGFVEKARENGFTELVFTSDSPLLRRFFKQKRYGFVECEGELRKFL